MAAINSSIFIVLKLKETLWIKNHLETTIQTETLPNSVTKQFIRVNMKLKYLLVLALIFFSFGKAVTLNFRNDSDAYPIYITYNIATFNPDGSITWGEIITTPEILAGNIYVHSENLGINQKVFVQGVSVIQPWISWIDEYCDHFQTCMTHCEMDNDNTYTSYIPVTHYKDYPIITREVLCNSHLLRNNL